MNATSAFGLELYQRLRSEPGNLLVSPYSIWACLAMLYPGARGATREELGHVLGISGVDDVTAVGQALAARAAPTPHQQQMVARGYQQAGGFGFHLAIANKLWVQTGYRIDAAYAEALAQAFGVDPAPVDFAKQPGPACDAINRWVHDQTRGRIANIVSAPQLPPHLRALLANAIYFKAGWSDEFMTTATQQAPFHLLDAAPVHVPLMHAVRYLGHAEDDLLTAVELPYIQPEVAMLVLLPRPGKLADAERDVSLRRLDRLIAGLSVRRIDLYLPRFTFETSLGIAPALREVGLGNALSPAADLSGVSTEPGFGVSEVLHKTFIAVDEKGTEAAAVTAMMVAGCAPPRDVPLEVCVDRPFYVLIRDVPTGTVLFFGRVVDPRSL